MDFVKWLERKDYIICRVVEDDTGGERFFYEDVEPEEFVKLYEQYEKEEKK